jgi:diadenosine tetraphosphatase ApaH/serine/threonine PP2A family protein phosphatase
VKRAILSDVHGNLPALEATLADADKRGAESIAFLGDAVGYGPEPNECVALLSRSCAVCLMGNHDYAALGSLSIDEFNGYAREAMMLTRQALTDVTLATLTRYRQVQVDPPYHMVHSSPDEPLAWKYIVDLRDAIPQFRHFRESMCLVGHSHKPLVAIERPSGSHSSPEGSRLVMEEEYRYLINVGSVGQPRDGNPDASYLLVDEEARTFEIRRVAYPVDRVQAAMEELNMPAFLIERLAAGK